MATNNTIPKYTAVDIEKYHQGQLSNAERHAMEKAALEDPFLADALEGFATPGINAGQDLAMLRQLLANRIEKEEKKIVPLGGSTRKFPWFRVAAAVVLIGGTALLANQLLFKQKDSPIAKAETTTTPAPAVLADSASPAQPANAGTAPTTQGTTAAQENTQVTSKENPSDKGTGAIAKTNNVVAADDAVQKPTTQTAPVATNPVQERKEVAVNNMPAKPVAGNASVSSENKVPGRAEERMAEAAADKEEKARSVAAAKKLSADEDRYRRQTTNIFRGRVTDASNKGVPFANVTNVEDKVGTYTDVNGYFNLTSPDTVLNVQVRSVGFENNQLQLKNVAASNKVVLREDHNVSQVVISNAKPNLAARNNRDANRTLQEPEPADGWENYDTYLVNNLEVPDEVKTRQSYSGSVQISFEVDKNGEPVNIRVEKSLCEKCDKEAIRLIKDGPKWRRMAANKNGRTTVTINF